MYRLALFIFSLPLFAQISPIQQSLLVNSAAGISSTGQVIDNRAITARCSIDSFNVISGTGNWSAQLEWSDVSQSGPWQVFSSLLSVVNSSSATPIGYGYGFHNFIRINTTAGTTISNFSCQNQFYIVPGGASGFAPATIGSFLLKGNGSGGFAQAFAADIPPLNYAPATTGTSVLKANGMGGFASAIPGTDYLGPTTGSAIQKANGVGGLTAATQNDFLSALWLNIVNFGGVPNVSDSCANDAAVTAANMAAVISGSPTIILFPAGTWYQCSTYNPPPNVRYVGVSQWAQEPEFGTVSGTVLKAGASFAVGSTLPSDFQIFLGNNGGHDDYGSGVENMHLDGSGIADSIYVGHVNEGTTVRWVEGLNFVHAGLFVCGADNGGPCTYFGKTGEAGAQVEGEFSDLIFSSNDAFNATASTVAVYLVNITGNRAIKNITIVPVTSNPANIPTSGMVMWGIKTNIENIHGQNVTSLLTLSPSSSPFCPSSCNGSISDKFDTLDLTQAPTPNYVVNILAATDTNLTFRNITDVGGSGATCKIQYNLSNGYSGCVTNQVSEWSIDGNGIPQSIENGEIFNGVTVTNGLLSVNGAFQFKGPSPTFGTTPITQASAGDLTIGFTGTSGNLLFARNFYTYAFYTGSAFSSININPLYDSGNTGMRGSVCNDIYWFHATQNWLLGSNGGGDFGCLGFGNGFTGIVTNNGYSAGASVSQASYNANFALITLNNGHTIAGKGSVNSSGAVVSDSGSSLQSVDTVSAKVYTVATLPATCTAGQMASVSDATTPTYNGVLTGGSTVFTTVACIGGNVWHSF